MLRLRLSMTTFFFSAVPRLLNPDSKRPNTQSDCVCHPSCRWKLKGKRPIVQLFFSLLAKERCREATERLAIIPTFSQTYTSCRQHGQNIHPPPSPTHQAEYVPLRRGCLRSRRGRIKQYCPVYHTL